MVLLMSFHLYHHLVNYHRTTPCHGISPKTLLHLTINHLEVNHLEFHLLEVHLLDQADYHHGNRPVVQYNHTIRMMMIIINHLSLRHIRGMME